MSISKSFWVALTFIFAIAFSSLSAYIYLKEVLLQPDDSYVLESSDGFVGSDEDCE